MTDEYDKGFKDGLQFAIENYDPETGKMNSDLPKGFVHRFGHYNAGFAEGLITGRGKVIDKAFPNLKEIYWRDGKSIVTFFDRKKKENDRIK